jgi:hypothetical protein
VWLFGKYKDLFILFIPVWIIWIVLFFLPNSFLQNDVPLWIWAVFILGIDVTHVWSTLFRTYLDKEEFKNHKTVLILAPIIAFILLFGIAREAITYFWRVLAYLAVFHFMKQQYGFLALFTAKAKIKNHHRIFKDKWILYFSMLYPVLFWHLSDRNFVWFVDGDFFSTSLQFPWRIISESVYWLAMIGWLIEEISLVYKKLNTLSYGRILWLMTTLFNWYLGIVFFNSDIAFTLTNVVAHGIPYLALVLFYQIKKNTFKETLTRRGVIWTVASIVTFSFLLAFGEEYLWDLLINREKAIFFTSIFNYPIESIVNSTWKIVALVLLSLPQVTHYILDGFIWKMNDSNPHLKHLLISDKNG